MIKNVKHYILKDFKGKDGQSSALLDGVTADSIFNSDPVKYWTNCFLWDQPLR